MSITQLSGSKRPNLDVDGMDQEKFGLNSGTTFPSNAMNWQTQPTRKTNPTHTYPLLFYPTSGNPQKHWTTGQPLFMLKEKNKRAHTLYGLSEVLYHLRNSSEFDFRHKKKGSDNLAEIRAENGLLSQFSSVEEFSKNMEFVGVAYSMPDPSLQDGILSNQYSNIVSEQSGALAITITTHGHCFFPDVFCSSMPIDAGQKLYMIIKKVSVNDAHEFRHYETSRKIETGLASSIKAEQAYATDLSCLDIVFYTHPDNEPPSYIDYAKSWEDANDPFTQTSKNCRLFKDLEADETTDPLINTSMVNQTNLTGSSTASLITSIISGNTYSKQLKEGIVYCIGQTLHSYRPLRGANYGNKGWSSTDILKLRKLEINLNIQRV